VADVEHIGALVAGGLLLVSGFRRRDLMGRALRLGGLAFVYRGQKGYRRLYEALGISLPATPTGVGRQNARVQSSVTVSRPRDELYRIWRNLGNLPVFMDHLLSVHEIDDERSIWVAKAPAGMVIKWDAQIINDQENELIAWQTLEGSGVDHAGSVRFEDAGPGKTTITVIFRYDPPADALGIWLAKALGNNPQSQLERDLGRFKSIMEIGGKPKGSRRPTAKMI
jgi:uncharacterized membrane protein